MGIKIALATLSCFLKNHTNFVSNWKGHDRWPYDKKTLEIIAKKMFARSSIRLSDILVYLEYTIKLKENSGVADEVWLKDVSSILELYANPCPKLKVMGSVHLYKLGMLIICGFGILTYYGCKSYE